VQWERSAAGAPLVVVGIGADGWDGLSPRARCLIEAAHVLRGSPRQLELVPAAVTAERVPWPSPKRAGDGRLPSVHAPNCGPQAGVHTLARAAA
jgi:precorrin-6Y C5,15-methyltransferase (decarboxylating)